MISASMTMVIFPQIMLIVWSTAGFPIANMQRSSQGESDHSGGGDGGQKVSVAGQTGSLLTDKS